MHEHMKLTGRELEIMNLLWESAVPMAAKDIIKIKPSLPMNTVQWALKNLLKKKYIKVSGVGYSNTVLTRNYIPALSAEEYMVNQLTKSDLSRKFSIEGVMAALLKDKSDEETIEKLEELLQQHRDNL